jgi:predicted transcriptional regulator
LFIFVQINIHFSTSKYYICRTNVEHMIKPEPEFTLNEIFAKLLSDSKYGQTSFADLVGISQPVIHHYVTNKTELRYSQFKRFCSFLGTDYDIVLASDKNDVGFDLVDSLKKSEVKLINSFSKETDFDVKYKLLRQIEAIKTLLIDNEKTHPNEYGTNIS